jgi:cellobiose epimerase
MNDNNNSGPAKNGLNSLSDEIAAELNNILHYWEQHTLDREWGGFQGRIDQDNQVDAKAPKGSVLNSRILWSFSAVYHYTQNPLHLELATRAYHYIREYFSDPDFGGLYWSVSHQGTMLDDHKQIYAQAFGIYAMSEYYRVTKNPRALELCQEWYMLIEKYSRDPKHGGYIEAFARDWTFLADKRLSAKDENASKTMNTHLHIVEAYANLYEVWPSQRLKKDIIDLLKIFESKIIHPSTHHLILFFGDDWQTDESIISYGHDMEAGWLLQSCAVSVGDNYSIETTKRNALLITGAAIKGIDKDGGLMYEFNNNKQEFISEKHWWPQAEALIGFCNAWQLTGNTLYKNFLLKSWRFIQDHILDKTHGEWLWGIDRDNKKMINQDKIGMWKGPYHNCRACLELLKRLKPQKSVEVW